VQKNAQGDFELELYGRYLMGPSRYTTIKRRPTICIFTARKTLGKDGFVIERHRVQISKDRYQTMIAGGGNQSR
jgi:hypothetical protein